MKVHVIHELWRRGNLNYLLHDGQTLLENNYQSSSGKIVVFNCSRRYGKTFWAIKKSIEVSLNKSGVKVKFATAFQKDVEEIVMPIALQMFADCPDELKPNINRTKKKFEFRNGSEIQLVGLDKNPDGGRGQYCDLYIFDEAAFIRNLEYVYSSVVIPMTMYRDNAKVVMISTPPKSPDHPFKMFCDKASSEGSYVKLTIHENPRVSKELIEEYRKECLTVSDFKREYECEFIVDETLSIIPEYERSNVLISNTDYNTFKQLIKYSFLHGYVCMDLGVKHDLTAILFAKYDFENACLIIEDEAQMNGPEMTTDKLKDLIALKELELWGHTKPYRRISDNNNPLLLQDMQSLHGMSFISTGKDTLEIMVNNLRLWVNSGRIKIHERCEMLLGCLENGIWDEKNKHFARSFKYKHYDHLAALIYLVRNIDEHTNPIPRTLGKNLSNIFIEDEESHQELRKIFNL